MAMPTWISEFQALSTAAIAGTVAFIAIQQFRIAKRKLKFDLYERRYSIYNAMREYLVLLFDSEEDMAAIARKAYEKKAEARFLLDAEACAYIEKFVNEISSYHNLRAMLRGKETDGMALAKTDIATENRKRMQWIFDQYAPLSAEFDRFLNLDHALGISPFAFLVRVRNRFIARIRRAKL